MHEIYFVRLLRQNMFGTFGNYPFKLLGFGDSKVKFIFYISPWI